MAKNGKDEKAMREKFKELAEYRMEQALHYIGLLGNLSNDRAYKFNAKDVSKMTKALNGAITQMKSRYDANATKKSKFSLED